MRRLLTCVSAALCLFVVASAIPTVSPAARADAIDVQPAGSAPIPGGPATAWIVADMDTGQVLAGRNEEAQSPPASTIKTLLAQVVLDEVPLDSTIVASEATEVSHRLALVLLPLTVGAAAATSYLTSLQGGGAPIVASAGSVEEVAS